MKTESSENKAVCLLSGGLDSTTALYVALRQGYRPFALTLNYGQRHDREIECARRTAKDLGLEWRLLTIELPWKGSALLDREVSLPLGRDVDAMAREIPATYVPGRNTIFLSLALSWAETLRARAVFIGANVLDYSGYPDCRPEYFSVMENIFEKGTKAGAEGKKIRIETPLLRKTKAEIVRLARELGVPLENTWSCYSGGEKICGACDSCLLREKGFLEAGVKDPLRSL